MATINEIKARLSAIGDEIREKRNETELYRLSAMPEKIRGLIVTGVVVGNLLFSSTNKDGTPFNGGLGYENGKSFDGNGNAFNYGVTSVSGYMPVSYGQTILFENLGIYTSTAGHQNFLGCTMVLYDNDKNVITSDNFYGWTGNTGGQNMPVWSDNTLTSITLKKSYYAESIEDVAYFRISFITDDLSENSAVFVRG